ncbi:putative MFS family arabinose efflux permease [Saccharothrix tamanrassetensis]|uniref:Putative MFS family arabinose efflux permease n=1 Tax=Saccharothrix tamanrassetensis TaxID=1051531 RepID=A0A841CS55_9PSEU|nr:MFS transporter [Saccharothrix tamanrassetensis]MBB5960090.1 putative MFS family arabinose efflux permease [Saccharothrix tamanrassetensis]
MSTATTAAADPSAGKGRLAVLSVTTGIFAIVTTEILPIGLLTSIGAEFAVSDGTAGLMMTLPGFLAALAAPALTVATARVDRRLVLCAFMLLLTLANVLAAIASAYWVLLVSRVLVGITIGGFWSIGASLAGRLVPPASAARATAVIFAAVPLGSVLGVPAGTFIGDLAGWRVAFVVLAVLSGGVLAALPAVVPPLPAVHATRLDVLRAVLRATNTRVGLLVTFLIVLAHFGTYTYVTPFLEQVTHAGSGVVTVFLLVYGAAGIAGNFLAGARVARYPRATFGASAALLAGSTLLLPVAGRDEVGALVLLVVWGVAYGAVPVCSQTWFTKSAPDTPEAASVLFTASFQATIGIGALAGGVVVDRGSPSEVMVVGGLVAVLVVVAVSLHFTRRVAWPVPSTPRR